MKYILFIIMFFSGASYSLAEEDIKDSKITCSFDIGISDSGAEPKLNNPVTLNDREKCFNMFKVRGGFSVDEFMYREVILSSLALIFGLLILVGIYKIRNILNSDDLIKLSGFTIIATGTLFMISAGWGSNQIAPAMGLFGTLAGYLLSRNSK